MGVGNGEGVRMGEGNSAMEAWTGMRNRAGRHTHTHTLEWESAGQPEEEHSDPGETGRKTVGAKEWGGGTVATITCAAWGEALWQ